MLAPGAGQVWDFAPPGRPKERLADRRILHRLGRVPGSTTIRLVVTSRLSSVAHHGDGVDLDELPRIAEAGHTDERAGRRS